MTCRTVLRGAFVFAAALFLSATAHAQLFRAYLSSAGSDTNPCTLPQPCRLLPAALAAVADGGEIWMLDSANYNTATVDVAKSVSILAIPGAVASVLAIGGPAINIAASLVTVALRNLVIAPLPSSGATDGVRMTGASWLTIEKSLIANLPGEGVYVSGPGSVKIANSTIRNNGNYAVYLRDGPLANVSGTQMLGNGNGAIFAYGTAASTTTASVSDSAMFGGYFGVNAYATIADAVARIAVTRCTIENVTYSLVGETLGVGSAVVAVSDSMIANNGYAWYQIGAGSVIRTLGNNHIADNTFSPVGVLTPTALQ